MQFLLAFFGGLFVNNLIWWIIVPLVPGALVFYTGWNKKLEPDGAWAAVIRCWCAIGWAILITSALFYLLSGLLTETFGFMTQPELTKAAGSVKTGWLKGLSIFISTWYAWIAPLILLLIWFAIAVFAFLLPGYKANKPLVF